MNLNGLNCYLKTYVDWHDFDAILGHKLNCQYIELLEVERYEEGLYLSFKILDPTKMDEIISLFKGFCEGLNIEHLDIFDEITDFCENNSDCEEYEVSVDTEILYKIVEQYYKETYDNRISLVCFEASFEGVGVVFVLEDIEL